ncbi:MAG: ATP-grasp domain-containing protein [Isosphaeraceae bacterium]|nr:ATP-grasp domain-containing protein [Isosphaeraceae bacterium]
MHLLILGACVRAAAHSALRAGFQPIGLDLFVDRDLIAVGPARRLPPDGFPLGFADLAAEVPLCPWIYTGGLENHPDLIDRIAASRPLWGNAATTLRAVRDPLQVADVLARAGLPHPEVRSSPAGLPRDGTWLIKPRASAGGRGIRPLLVEERDPPQDVYFQKRLEGPVGSGLFLGERTGARLLGVTQQLHGPRGTKEEFLYRGSIGPWPVAPATRDTLEQIGHLVGREFGLVGLFGIDFVLQGVTPWPLEINPRYTASIETLELALGRSLLIEHVRGCAPEVLGRISPRRAHPRSRPLVVGKEILYATRSGRFPETVRGSFDPARPFAVPLLADLPEAGMPFGSGEPLASVFALGPTFEVCRARLRVVARHWRERLGG